jgi:hypothetical protein
VRVILKTKATTASSIGVLRLAILQTAFRYGPVRAARVGALCVIAFLVNCKPSEPYLTRSTPPPLARDVMWAEGSPLSTPLSIPV